MNPRRSERSVPGSYGPGIAPSGRSEAEFRGEWNESPE